MRRREFIAGVGGAAVWPLAARAQQPQMPVIGILSGTSPEGYSRVVASIRMGLADVGYVEGQNIRTEFRWARDRYDQLPALAADLVKSKVNSIVAIGSAASPLAAKAATAAIPIVFVLGSDPVELGLVASLNRPGGNVTGVTSLGRELLAKRLELLREVVPNVTTIGLLVNPNNLNTDRSVKEMQSLARAGGFRVYDIPVSTQAELDAAFATFAQQQVGGFLHATDALFTSQIAYIGALAQRYALPGIFTYRQAPEVGGLMSCGSGTDVYRIAGVYTGRILKGETPADLPVQQATKIELVINRKTANALGLTVPQSILLRADEVIE